jgi:hypothetical protein
MPRGPRAVVRAMGGGIVSLFRHTSEGTLSSLSAFTSSLSKNLERLAPEDLYSLERQVRLGLPWVAALTVAPRSQVTRNARPGSVLHGLGQGIRSFSQSVVGGIAGVVTGPVRGSAAGPWGFVKGVGTGLVGAVAKPLSGMMDLVTHTSRGLAVAAAGGEASMFQRRSQPAAWSARPGWDHCLWLRALATESGEAYVAHTLYFNALQFYSAGAALLDERASPGAKQMDVTLTLLTTAGVQIFSGSALKHSLFWREAADFDCRCAHHPACLTFSFRGHEVRLLRLGEARDDLAELRRFMDTLVAVYVTYREIALNAHAHGARSGPVAAAGSSAAAATP